MDSTTKFWALFEPIWRILADFTAVARQAFSPNDSEGGCCNLHKSTWRFQLLCPGLQTHCSCHGYHHHGNNVSSCEVFLPSSRYCIGVYLLNYPLSSCFLTHHSTGKQAGLVHALTDAMLGLQRSENCTLIT